MFSLFTVESLPVPPYHAGEHAGPRAFTHTIPYVMMSAPCRTARSSRRQAGTYMCASFTPADAVLRPPGLAERIVSCAEIDDGRRWTEPTGRSKLVRPRHRRATSLAVGQSRGSVISCRTWLDALRQMAWHPHGGARACEGSGPAL